MSNMPQSNGRGRRSDQFSRRGFLAAAAGASVALGAMPVTVRAGSGLVALVHTQAAGDSGPIDSMMGRLNRLSEDRGFESRAIYAQDPATYETTLRTLGDAGAAIVIGTVPVISEAFKAAAPAYPETRWIQLFGDPVEPAIPNLVTVSYDYYLGCYVSGIFAAHISTTRKIGYIGGISIPPLNADFNALKAGVHAADPKATVTAAFAGSFQDPAKGYGIASQMFVDGIDYIQTDSAATDGGIIQAANERPGRMVSALDPAQYALGPAFGTYGVLSCFVLLMPVAVCVMWVLLRRTRFGLRLAAAGEHPLAARSVGASPARARFIAFAIGGVLCAIGGAELAAGGLHIFAQNMTAGRGFMSFAAVIFGAAHPVGSAFAAMFFSLAGVAGIRLQLLFGASIPHDVLLSLPYLATVFGLWISGRMRGGAEAVAEASELRDE